MLEEAGWVLDGDVRVKDGKELSISYYTSINSVRQKTQAVNKDNWEQAGIKVQLGQVTADIFFSSAPGNDQTFYHNYRDIDMFTDGPTSPVPLTYMLSYYAGPDNVNVSQKSNQWTGANTARYVNPDYDALYDQARRFHRSGASRRALHPDERHPDQRLRADPGRLPRGHQERGRPTSSCRTTSAPAAGSPTTGTSQNWTAVAE